MFRPSAPGYETHMDTDRGHDPSPLIELTDDIDPDHVENRYAFAERVQYGG